MDRQPVVSIYRKIYGILLQFGKESPTLLICSLCAWFIVFVCLSLWCWGLMWIWLYQFLSSLLYGVRSRSLSLVETFHGVQWFCRRTTNPRSDYVYALLIWPSLPTSAPKDLFAGLVYYLLYYFILFIFFHLQTRSLPILMMMSKRKINPIERQERQAHPMRVLLLKRLTLLQAINSDVFCCEDACFDLFLWVRSSDVYYINRKQLTFQYKECNLLSVKTAQNRHQFGSATEA